MKKIFALLIVICGSSAAYADEKIIGEEFADYYNSVLIKIVEKDNLKGAYTEAQLYTQDRTEREKRYNKQFVPIIYDEAQPVYNGCIVTKNNKKGYYHIDKGLILPVEYDSVSVSTSPKNYQKHILEAKSGDKTVKKEIPLNYYENSKEREYRAYKLNFRNIFDGVMFNGLH